MHTHQLDLNEASMPNQQTPANSNSETQQSIPIDDPALQATNQNSGPRLRQYTSNPSTTMKHKKIAPIPLIATVLIAIVLGVGSGYAINSARSGTSPLPGQSATPIAQIPTGTINAGDVFGSVDTSAFPDSAEGYLQSGGLEGEGSHSLLRPGGPTQTVYLTSSVTDLSKLEGMDVKVWGETFKGQKAGWLMDVGRVEVIRTQGEMPE